MQELVAGEHVAHRHNLLLPVRDFDADSSLARDRRDDTDAQSREAQRDIVLQILDFADTDSGCWHDFVQGDGRADRGRNLVDGNAVVEQGVDNLVFVSNQFFFHVLNLLRLVAEVLQEVQSRELVVGKFQAGIKGCVDAEVIRPRHRRACSGRLFLIGPEVDDFQFGFFGFRVFFAC